MTGAGDPRDAAAARAAHAEGACPLCERRGEPSPPVVETECARVIRVTDVPGFPAFYRVVWSEHIKEMSDLTPSQRGICMEVVTLVEKVLRQLSPHKINLASLGNMVPHLHWHVIARFDWDSRFPDAIWAGAHRPDDAQRLAALAARLPALDAQVARAVGAAFPPPPRSRRA